MAARLPPSNPQSNPALKTPPSGIAIKPPAPLSNALGPNSKPATSAPLNAFNPKPPLPFASVPPPLSKPPNPSPPQPPLGRPSQPPLMPPMPNPSTPKQPLGYSTAASLSISNNPMKYASGPVLSSGRPINPNLVVQNPAMRIPTQTQVKPGGNPN